MKAAFHDLRLGANLALAREACFDVVSRQKQVIPLPDGLAGAMHGMPLDVRGATAVMLPDRWTKLEQYVEPVRLRVLHDPYVFGGAIRQRDSRYHWGGQLLLTRDAQLLSASYGVLDRTATLPADILQPLSDDPSRFRLCRFGKATYHRGIYLFVGSLHRHFGHFLLEGLSRLWALSRLDDELRDSVKLVVYEEQPRPFAFDVLSLLGISRDRIVSPGRLSQFESLIVPDVAFRTHHWITPLQRWTWQSIGSKAGDDPPPNRRIFLSRRYAPDRPLRNIDEIERQFTNMGYEIVIPEKLPIREQISLARQACALAGCVGSQMYLAAFQQPGAHNTIIAPRNFFLSDDLLISHVNDGELTVYFGTSIDLLAPKAQREWTFRPNDLDC